MNKSKKRESIVGECLKGMPVRHDSTVPLKNERGITLIALVITIIILLILAGVTLNIVFNGGLMDKAQNSVDQYADKAQNETEILEYIDKKFGQALGIALDNTSGSKNEKLIEQTDDVKKYCNPVIPVGFKTINTPKASWKVVEDETLGKIVQGWNEGLVIEDSKGNQFVWVPVDGTNVKYEYYYSVGSSGHTDYEQDLPMGADGNEINENTQITNYGGFYIARYEAGIPSTLTEALTDTSKRNVSGIPVSKQNQIPWNKVSWSQAKANAESMYTTTNVQSVLITDRMWETTCKWLASGTQSVNVTTSGNGSIDWGNYNNAPVTGITEYSENFGATWTPKTDNNSKGTSVSWLLKTGHTEYTNRKNIYDLAGNLWEWTNSKYSSISSNYVLRGGVYNNNGTSYPSAYRDNYSDSAHNNISFRVGLFIQ